MGDDYQFSPQLTTAVLTHFHLAPAAPDVAFLERLVNAYVRTVPWETVFRIVKRGKTAVCYDKIVEAMGGYGKFVETAVSIIPALERAFASGKLACVNVSLDAEGMSKTSA